MGKFKGLEYLAQAYTLQALPVNGMRLLWQYRTSLLLKIRPFLIIWHPLRKQSLIFSKGCHVYICYKINVNRMHIWMKIIVEYQLISKNLAKLKQHYYFHAEFLEEMRQLQNYNRGLIIHGYVYIRFLSPLYGSLNTISMRKIIEFFRFLIVNNLIVLLYVLNLPSSASLQLVTHQLNSLYIIAILILYSQYTQRLQLAYTLLIIIIL